MFVEHAKSLLPNLNVPVGAGSDDFSFIEIAALNRAEMAWLATLA